VYETEQAAMSVKQICPRFKRMREELYDDDFRWRLIYDEAESWFRNEALEAFGEAWEPSQKAMNDKANGISLIKDILNAEKIFISERCKKFWWELDNYYKDKNGNIPKKWDHLIDTARYILAADAYTLTTEEEKLIEPEDMPRPEKLPLDWEEWNGLQEDQDWALF